METLNGLSNRSTDIIRVAGYCRTSAKEEQLFGSYVTQKKFLKKVIEEHEGWIFAGVFGDYARTGTQVQGRSGFQQLMQMAENGEVNLILTKSISRFSRSASDTLEYVRKLSSHGVGVYFMEQSFDTRDEYAEIILTTLATIAEMESNSISESIRDVFNGMNAKGTPLRKASYGYKREGKEWIVVPDEAKRIKLAYLMAAHGYCFAEIARRLNHFETVERSGRKWDTLMVKRALVSETYVGDILTNKTVKAQKEGVGRRWIPNNRQEDQYYIDNHHAPLVGRKLWRTVSAMAKNRELAGQENFYGVDKVLPLAKEDKLLNEVRRLVPKQPGKWM